MKAHALIVNDRALPVLAHQAGSPELAAFRFKFLAGSLVLEFLCETIPQLVVQGINNDLRSTWNVFTVTSFVVASFCWFLSSFGIRS